MTDPPCDTGSVRLTISLFSDEHDTQPRREETTWGDLRARLLRIDLRDGKSGPAWSPVRYSEGATRGNAGVEMVYTAVMDVDDGTDPEMVHRRLSELGFEHVIHSTHSSTPEHPKFRVIVPLGNSYSAASWPAVFPRVCALLTDGHTDPSTKDPARLFYL
ncbi:DNA primase domain protein, partial [mine drainage metagenome]